MRWLTKLWNYLKGKKEEPTSSEMKAYLTSVKYEEEALARLKRIGDLREEVQRVADKVIRKRVKQVEDGIGDPEPEVLNSRKYFGLK